MEGGELKIHVGYEKGTGGPVDIELSPTSPHISIFGQTGLGKTELVRRIIEEISKADPSYRILVFDTRADVQEFRGEGNRLPIYVRETTDPLVLKGLLESIIQSSLKREYATLVRVSEGTQDYGEVVDRLDHKIADKKTHAVVKDMCVLLRDLLQRLRAEMRETETAGDVELAPGLNVMALNERSKQFKQLTVRAVLPHVYRKYRKMVVFLDEGQEYIPQKYSSAATEAVDDYIRTARGKEDYLVIAAQSITGTSKDPIKQVHTWIHFGQATRGEAKEALEYIPHAEKLGLGVREVQTMGTGWSVVNTKSWAKRTYVQPTWLPEDIARQVSTGERFPHEVQNWERKARLVTMERDERKKYEAEIEGLKKQVKDLDEQLDTAIRERQQWAAQAKAFTQMPEKQNKVIQELSGKILKADRRVKELEDFVKQQQTVMDDLERRLRDSIKAATEPKVIEIGPATPEAIEQTAKHLSSAAEPIYETGGIPIEALAQKVAEMLAAPKAYHLNISVAVPELKLTERVIEVAATDEEPIGRVAKLIAEGFFDERRAVTETITEFKARGWGETLKGGAGWNNMNRWLTKFAEMGFLRYFDKGYIAIPEAKARIKRVRT